MTRKERCIKCFKVVVGLYMVLNKPKRQHIRKAYYCRNCKLVLNDNQICIKQFFFTKEGVENK